MAGFGYIRGRYGSTPCRELMGWERNDGLATLTEIVMRRSFTSLGSSFCGKLTGRWVGLVGILVLIGFVPRAVDAAPPLTTLLSFNGTNGAWPQGSLTLSNSTLYGMTWGGGSSSDGNIFSIGTNGTNFQNLFSFNGSNGQWP